MKRVLCKLKKFSRNIKLPALKDFTQNLEIPATFEILNPKFKKDLSIYEIPVERKIEISNWEKDVLQYEFQNKDILNSIFLAPTYLLLHGKELYSKQFTYLGASILRFLISSHIVQQYPSQFIGDIVIIEKLLYEEMLDEIKTRFSPEKLVLTNMTDPTIEGGHIYEALLGAIYVDSGFESLYQFLSRDLLPHLKKRVNEIDKTDYVSKLKEILEMYKTYPEYRFMNKRVPIKPNEIFVGVFINQEFFEYGNGKTFNIAKYHVSKKLVKEFESNTYRLDQLREKHKNYAYIHSLKDIFKHKKKVTQKWDYEKDRQLKKKKKKH